MTTARWLHGLVIVLLGMQLLLGSGLQQPLAWGAGLLLLLAALKLRESRRAAELQRVALTEWVALGLLAALQPQLGSGLLQALSAMLMLTAVLLVEGGGQQALGPTLRRSLQLSLAALPVLVLLFLLLPRLGPFWNLGGKGVGRSGISGLLDPGGISRLVRDPGPALRISGSLRDLPPPQGRYWRVVVLDAFNGRRWSRSSESDAPVSVLRAAGAVAGPARQIWVAEPSPLPMLPWAGSGQPSDPALAVTSEGLLLSPWSADRRRVYGLHTSAATPAWWQRPPQPAELAFPAGSNPRLEAIGAAWRQRPALARLQAARALLQRQQLRYTLEPPALPQQAPLDALLFHTRAGFCEHFASVFTALMRAAGVPARVVVGYQGGEWVAGTDWAEGYLDVRQSDAHAWSEIWLEGAGWVRVDPTAWLAPLRLEQDTDGRGGWWSDLERSWTRLDLSWNRWVLSFDASQQDQLLGRWRPWRGLLLLAGLATALAPALWWLQRPPQQPAERERQQLNRALARLRRWGLEPAAGETLTHFCQRASQAQPALRAPLTALAASYDALRFSAPGRTSAARTAWRRAQQELAQALRRRRQGPVQRAK
jgi:transglutaminase-like putative cysteine protease